MTQTRTPKKSYWGNPKLVNRIKELIEKERVLLKGEGRDGGFSLERPLQYIATQLNKEFKEYLTAEKHRITLISLRSKIGNRKALDDIVWTKERGLLLGQYVAEGWPLDKYYRDYPFIPKVMIDDRAKQLRGGSHEKSPVPTVHGILRLVPDGATVVPFELPHSDVNEPIVLQSEGVSGLMLLNGIQIGLPYDGRMSRNVPRCAMEIAEREGLAVFLTGGLMHLRLKQAHGNSRNFEARTSAMDLDLDVMDPNYKRSVLKMMNSSDDVAKVVYTTLLENFENLRAALRKIFSHTRQSGGGPRYTVPIYLQLGAPEELLITIGAYYELRIETFHRRALLQKRIQEAQARLNTAWTQEKQNEYEMLVAELSRTVLTNVHDRYHIDAYEKVRSYVVAQLQDAIPGVHVIGSMHSFVQFQDQVIELKHVGNDALSLALIDDYIQSEGNNATRTETLADFVVLCNRYNPHVGETFIDNTRFNEKKSVPVLLLPVAIDGEYIKKKFKERGLSGGQTKIQKLVGHDRFLPQVVVLSRKEQNWMFDLYGIPSIQYLGGPLKDKATWKRRKGDRKYFNSLSFSDIHSGHPWEEHIFDRKHKEFLDLTSAFLRLLRESKQFGRVHSFAVQDDLVQGANFANHLQPHENVMSLKKLEEYMRTMQSQISTYRQKGSHGLADSYEEELFRTMMRQRIVKGEYRSQDQFLRLFEGLIIHNVDFFASVLDRHMNSGIRWHGVSSLRNNIVDTRDLKAITLGNGNHWRHTGIRGESHISEGFIVAEMMKALLRYYPGAKQVAHVLDELVGSPLHGQDFLGLAVVEVMKGIRFAFHMRGSPTRKGSANGFPLEQAARNAITRGNHSDCFHGVETEVQLTGDIHKGGFVFVPGYLHVSCPAATRGDPYGIHGFARSHIGGVNIAYPKEGIKKAPVRITFFMGDWIDRCYALRGKGEFAVNFDELIPSPL